MHFGREAVPKYLMSSDKTPLPADVRTDTRDLPQRERVLALQFTGGIPHHEGAVGSVSQFLVHFLSANTHEDRNGWRRADRRKSPAACCAREFYDQSLTWRFLPSTTQPLSAGCWCPSPLMEPFSTWLVLQEELKKTKQNREK